MKNFLPKALLTALVILTLSASSALAASLTLTKIGAVDAGGKKISGQWWYTSTNPTLAGTAAESSTVTIKIDSVESTATADASGNWQFFSDKLTDGNHQVMISAGAESMSFSLNIGQDVPESTMSGTMGKNGNPIPVTGSSSIFTYMMISSVLLIGGGLLFLNKK